MKKSFSGQLYHPILYGIVHAIVDAATVSAVLTTNIFHELSPIWVFYFIVGYDLIAFAGQALFGLFADYFKLSRPIILLGITFSALAVVFAPVQALTTVVCAGIGNALFHVGGGALSLWVQPGRATPPGLFVAPGALGLGLGLFWGRAGTLHTWPLLVALLLAFAFASWSPNPKLPYGEKTKRPNIPWPVLAVTLLLFSIAIRSFIGHAGTHHAPAINWLPWAFAGAAFGGKALGGILSDRLGWIRTSVGALLISAPLIAFAGSIPAMLILGLFVFQMTMPVTLTAIAGAMPGRPAFAFGVACLALIGGAIPTYFPQVAAFYSPLLLFLAIVASAAIVFVGLRLLKTIIPS